MLATLLLILLSLVQRFGSLISANFVSALCRASTLLPTTLFACVVPSERCPLLIAGFFSLARFFFCNFFFSACFASLTAHSGVRMV